MGYPEKRFHFYSHRHAARPFPSPLCQQMKYFFRRDIIILLTICLSFSGCGYRFSVEGRGPTIGSSPTVEYEGPPVIMAFTPLDNRTFESNLEYKYTDYLKEEFVVTGGAKIVENMQDADYVLKGAIESVSLPSLTFSQNQTQESRVTVNVRVQVSDRRLGNILWQQSASGSAEFFVGSSSSGSGGGIQFNRVLQDRALEQAGQFVAEDLADQFLFAREQGVFTPKPTKPTSVTPPESLQGKDSFPLELQPPSFPSKK